MRGERICLRVTSWWEQPVRLKKRTVSPVEPLMALFLLAQSIICSWEMISVYSNAAPVTSLIRTQGENQARRRQTYENIQLLPLDSQSHGRDPHHVLVKGKKKGDYQSLIKMFSIRDGNKAWNKASKKDETQLQEKNKAVIREDSRKTNKHNCGHTSWIMTADEEDISHLWRQWLDHKYSHVCVSGE